MKNGAYKILATANNEQDENIMMGVYQKRDDNGTIWILEIDHILKDGFQSGNENMKAIENRTFKVNSYYRHAEKKNYQAIYQAIHAITGELYMVFTELSGEGNTLACKMSVFPDQFRHSRTNIL